MKMGIGLKTLLLSLSLIGLFLLNFDAKAKTLKVDTVTPSVTNGDLTLSKNGTGDILLGTGTGFALLTAGVLSTQSFIDLTSDVSTSVLPIANGGTNSSTALNNDFVIISSAGAMIESSTITVTELGYLDNVSSNIQAQLDAKVGTSGDESISGVKTFTGQLVASSTTNGSRPCPVMTSAQMNAVSSPSSGDCVYNTDELSPYYYDGSGWQLSSGSGGGGSAGINFVVDPSFEKNDLAFTNSLSGTTTYPTYTADDKLYSEFNEVYYQIAHTGLSAASYSVSHSVSRTGLDGKQGLFSIWAKVNNDVELCIKLDGSADCESTLTLNKDDTWRKYEIPFVFGASSVKFDIFNASLTGDITLQLDQVYVGTIPDGYIQEVGQAHFVGKINLRTNCQYTRSSSPYGYALDGDVCEATEIIGNLSLPDVSTRAGVKILNKRTDGYYKVVYTGLLYKVPSTGDCQFTWSKDLNQANNGEAGIYSTAGGGSNSTLTGTFRFDADDDGHLYMLVHSGASAACNIYGQSSNSSDISVYFYPDDKSTIVTQNTELTAKTANEFEFIVNTSGAIVSDTFNFLSSCSRSAQGLFSCTYNETLINSMNLTGSIDDANGACANGLIRFYTNSNTGFFYNVRDADSGALIDCQVNIKASKRGLDYNKSATIVGKFENINSSDLCQVDARGGSNQTITGSTEPIEFVNEYKDNCNAWDGDEYTAQKDGRILISGNYQNATALAFTVDVAIGSTVVKSCSGINVSSNNLRAFNCMLDVSAGDIVSMRLNTTTTASNAEFYHYITITELPDTEAIVKNLSDQKVKCQTKYLSADVSANGAINDLSFSNLDINKNYSLNVNVRWVYSTLNTCRVYFNDGGKNIIDNRTREADAPEDRTSYALYNGFFKPATSNLSANFIENNVCLLEGDGTMNETWATLCELPDTYVETTEW